MLFGGKRVADITADDIRGLVGAVAEGTPIDYKREIGANNQAKHEFAADVTSFANTEGGYILVGLTEVQGVASAIAGVQVADVDAEIQRLENLARDIVAPRLPSFEVGPVDVDGSRVLVIRIARSWSGPHMVTFQGRSNFYKRNSAGKYPLDVEEIRREFARSIEGATVTRAFHGSLVEAVARNLLTGVALVDGRKLALHLIPVGSLEGGQSVDISVAPDNARFRPMYSDQPVPARYTIDGVVAHDAVPPQPARRYVLLRRNGVIEAVDTAFLNLRPEEVLGSPFERTLVDDVSRFLALQRELGVEPPIVLLVTLLGVQGARIVPPGDPIPPHGGWPTIDRSPIALPEIVIDDFDVDLPTSLHPLFDAFWQSGAFPESPNYDVNGVWQRPQG